MTPDIKTIIEQQITALPKDKLRKSGISTSRFIDAYSTILGRVQKDIDTLMSAGFSPDKLPLYYGYLEMLSTVFASRTCSTSSQQKVRATLRSEMQALLIDKKRLSIIADFVTRISDTASVRERMRGIPKQKATHSQLQQILELVRIVKEFPHYMPQIKPGAFTINDAYLDSVEKRAMNLLSQSATLARRGAMENPLVDRTNRVITLCLNAISDIREFANAAYIDDKAHYRKYYTKGK